MKFVGIITHIIDRSGVSKNGEPFNAYQFRVEEKTVSYPQAILLDCYGDKYKGHIIGQYIEAEFNLRCDIFDGKLFGKCSAWKITVLAGPAAVDNRPLYNGHEDPLPAYNGSQDPLRAFEAKVDPFATPSGSAGTVNASPDINGIRPSEAEKAFEAQKNPGNDLPD